MRDHREEVNSSGAGGARPAPGLTMGVAGWTYRGSCPPRPKESSAGGPVLSETECLSTLEVFGSCGLPACSGTRRRKPLPLSLSLQAPLVQLPALCLHTWSLALKAICYWSGWVCVNLLFSHRVDGIRLKALFPLSLFMWLKTLSETLS